MSRNLLKQFSGLVNYLENVFPMLFRSGGPPPALALCGMPSSSPTTSNTPNFSLKDLIGDGLLWAVPKHRRTVEKRLNRKFGYPEYTWKPLRLKTNIRTCNQCGHHHEMNTLCPHCYEKVRQETQQMQEKIQEQLGLAPVDQEVVVLYEGERREQSSESLNGKRIVEMPKPRPMWFSKNLMQKTTQQPADTKEVKPSDLG